MSQRHDEVLETLGRAVALYVDQVLGELDPQDRAAAAFAGVTAKVQLRTASWAITFDVYARECPSDPIALAPIALPGALPGPSRN